MTKFGSPRRLGHVVPLIILNLIHIFPQINLLGLQPLRLLDEFPAEEQDREYANHGVTKEECRYIPESRQEDRISAYESHDEGTDQRVIGRERLPP